MDYLERRNDRFVFFVFRPRWSAPCPQNHITTSASHCTHSLLLFTTMWTLNNVPTLMQCLLKDILYKISLNANTLKSYYVEEVGRPPSNGYLSALLMHQVMHGRPDGALLMINLRCEQRTTVDINQWHCSAPHSTVNHSEQCTTVDIHPPNTVHQSAHRSTYHCIALLLWVDRLVWCIAWRIIQTTSYLILLFFSV